MYIHVKLIYPTGEGWFAWGQVGTKIYLDWRVSTKL